MQPFSRNLSRIAPWNAIGDFINTIRIGGAESPALDGVGAKDPATAPGQSERLFGYREKTIGHPAQLFPHAKKLDASEAAADPIVLRWLDMLERLRPFNAKGQVAGIHRYLTGVGDLSTIAEVARSLPWAGPITRASQRDGFGNAALIRYVSLAHLGFHPERLRLVWLTDRVEGTDWVVLAVHLGGQWLMLDHYHGDVVGDDVYEDAEPYFSLNANRCRLHWRPLEPNGAELALGRLGQQLRFSRA